MIKYVSVMTFTRLTKYTLNHKLLLLNNITIDNTFGIDRFHVQLENIDDKWIIKRLFINTGGNRYYEFEGNNQQ